MSTGIYEILNAADGKRYIGSAVNFSKRFYAHRRRLVDGTHHSTHLQRAWVKYGVNAFLFKPILTCQKSMLKFYEQQLLDKIKPEYNMSPTAGTTLGVRHSPAFGAAVAARMLGIKRSPTTRAKMSLALRGNKNAAGVMHSPEWRVRMSARLRGNTHTLGKKLRIRTSEQCAAISMRMMGNKNGCRPRGEAQ